MGKKLTFILGGARSGKSTYAQQLAEELSPTATFVATAVAFDEEMLARIRAHQAGRGGNWQTLEAPRAVGKAIQACPDLRPVVLLDCLTLLANNLLLDLPNAEEASEAALADTALAGAAEAAMDQEIDELLAAYQHSHAEWIIVSNEVGLGLVPAYPLGRIYRDVLGRANQRLARAADRVIFMVAGIPMTVK